jgi:hypothetical protein
MAMEDLSEESIFKLQLVGGAIQGVMRSYYADDEVSILVGIRTRDMGADDVVLISSDDDAATLALAERIREAALALPDRRALSEAPATVVEPPTE